MLLTSCYLLVRVLGQPLCRCNEPRCCYCTYEGCINYSNTTKNNTVYRRFGFKSEAFIRTDFRCRSSVCKSLSHTWRNWQLPSSRFMLSVFLIISPPWVCQLCLILDQPPWRSAFAQSITWFWLQTWSVIADLLQILAALVFSALVKIPVMLSTSLRCSFTLAPSGLPVSPT